MHNKQHICYCLLALLTLCVILVQGAFPGYRVTSLQSSSGGFSGTLELISAGPYGGDIRNLNFEVIYYTSSIFRLRVTDPRVARWEVPWVVAIKPPSTPPTQFDYTVSVPNAGPFGLSVTRKSTGESIFNSIPPNDSFNGTTYTLFAKDHGTPLVQNLYGSHPFYLEQRTAGPAHGVFFLNSNAMDVIVGTNKLTYKTVGGIVDLWFFLGPTPNEVVQQYNQVIGFPYLPAYWHLGWHQCRWGYNSVSDTSNAVAQYAKNNVPLDTIWNDIDYMDNYKDFTLSGAFAPSQMKQFLDELHSKGQHYVMIVDPGIANVGGYEPYSTGLQQDVFIKSPNGQQPIVGQVWPGHTVFPDFLNTKTHDWWFQQISQFHQNGMPFDGLWIDMNEPSNFCDGQCASPEESLQSKVISKAKAGYDPENPPYVPGGVRLDASTLNMTAIQRLDNANVLMYNTHNLYGFSEGIATVKALEKLRNKRALVISRSTFPGSGSHHGHWLGDNYSHWDNLYYSITGILSMNLFGIPLVGADVCGFNEDTNEELCSRWMQLGTLYPFSRNHNTRGARSQEPYAFGSVLLNTSRTALNLRYSLLPYYYTQFYNIHLSGGAFWRPLFFEFPADRTTYNMDRQFLIGPALLASPVLDQGANTVQAYFPAAYWYDWYIGKQVGNPSQGTTITLSAPLTSPVNLHIRGGYVIPSQRGALTTTASRLTPFTIVAALDGKGAAQGQLFLDDGEGLDTISAKNFTLIDFTVTNGNSFASKVTGAYSGAQTLTYERLEVYGAIGPVTSLRINGQVSTLFSFDAAIKRLSVSGVNGLSVSKALTVQW